MKLKGTKNWKRRDFTAILGCEHCGHIEEVTGYDDCNYYDNIIPDFECPICHKKGTKSENLSPRYPANVFI